MGKGQNVLAPTGGFSIPIKLQFSRGDLHFEEESWRNQFLESIRGLLKCLQIRPPECIRGGRLVLYTN